MNVRTAAIVFFTLLISSPTFSSTKAIKLVGDCQDAVEIIPNGIYQFDHSPEGFGTVNEFKNNPKKSLCYFENEINSAWFTFVVPTNGDLVFKIFPKNYEADFDFLLFEYTDEHFCDDLAAKKLKPVRSNISRFNPLEMSITGLSVSANQEFVHSGKGNHLSKALTVEKGQRYYLVINNVYGTDTPFRMAFSFYATTTISGTLRDEETGEIVGDAVVTWEEKSGEVLAQTTSNHETGRFEMEVPVQKSNAKKQYIISASKKDYFFVESTVLASFTEPVRSVNLVLPKLKKGLIRKQKNILFHTNKPIVLRSSLHSLKHLYKLMKKNPALEIRIDGHTHGEWDEDGYTDLDLSNWRTETIQNYLISRGISSSRIQTKGFGGTRMINPYDTTEKKQQENRRVEVQVLSF